MENQLKDKSKLVPVSLGTALLVASGSVFAEAGDLAEGATAAISSSSGTLKTVGIAIVTVVAGIWVIRRVIGLIR